MMNVDRLHTASLRYTMRMNSSARNSHVHPDVADIRILLQTLPHRVVLVDAVLYNCINDKNQ